MYLVISGLIFSIYVANVLLGALASASFMGDVSEMIVLSIASIAFVVAILKEERDAKQ
ncbi:MAG: hypothetical protein AAFY99_02235 [Pseudomonadota bacterium]